MPVGEPDPRRLIEEAREAYEGGLGTYDRRLLRDLATALRVTLARAEEAENARDSLRMDRDSSEHMRIKDNEYLIARAVAAEARAEKLEEARAYVSGQVERALECLRVDEGKSCRPDSARVFLHRARAALAEGEK